MQKVYDRVITACFNRPVLTIVLGVVSVGVGAWVFLSRPFQLMPIAERNQFAVEIFLPQGTSVERTTQVADSLEHILAADERVVSIASFHGCSSPRFQATYAPQVGGPNFAQFIVNTKSNQATIDVLNEYTGKYESWFPDAFVRFKQLSYSTADYPIEIRFTGADEATLRSVCDSMLQVARRVPGLRNVRSSLDNPMAAAVINPDVTLASRLGLNSVLLETTLAMRYSSGLPVATVWEGDYGIPVTLKTKTSDRATVEDLVNEPMPVIGFGDVPLSQIADVRPEWHPGTLTRYSGVPSVSLIAEVQRNVNVIDRTEALMDSISHYDIPADVELTRGGEWDNTMSTLPQILGGLAIAVVIIFFILLLHYAAADTALLLLGCLLPVSYTHLTLPTKLEV